MCFESKDLQSSTSHTTLAYNIKECHVISSLLGVAGIITKEWLRMLETFRFRNLNLTDASYTRLCVN